MPTDQKVLERNAAKVIAALESEDLYPVEIREKTGLSLAYERTVNYLKSQGRIEFLAGRLHLRPVDPEPAAESPVDPAAAQAAQEAAPAPVIVPVSETINHAANALAALVTERDALKAENARLSAQHYDEVAVNLTVMAENVRLRRLLDQKKSAVRTVAAALRNQRAESDHWLSQIVAGDMMLVTLRGISREQRKRALLTARRRGHELTQARLSLETHDLAARLRQPGIDRLTAMARLADTLPGTRLIDWAADRIAALQAQQPEGGDNPQVDLDLVRGALEDAGQPVGSLVERVRHLAADRDRWHKCADTSAATNRKLTCLIPADKLPRTVEVKL